MANLQSAFNEEGGAYQPGSTTPAAFDDLPAGDYPIIISDSEMKETKAGDGQYLNLTLDIIDGPSKGRKLFSRLNLINKNQTAVSIAKQQLESICRAIHLTEAVRDSAQLHNKPLVARVSYSEKNRKGDDIPEGQRNDIKAYKPMETGAVYQAPAPTPPAQQPFQAPEGQVPPAQQPALDSAPSTPW